MWDKNIILLTKNINIFLIAFFILYIIFFEKDSLIVLNNKFW